MIEIVIVGIMMMLVMMIMILCCFHISIACHFSLVRDSLKLLPCFRLFFAMIHVSNFV